jgi:cold shock CspA family protein
MIGTIVRIKEDKKYGFIRSSENYKEYFFHKDDFQGDWNDLVLHYNRIGSLLKVEFEVVRNPIKGPRAQNVRGIDE